VGFAIDESPARPTKAAFHLANIITIVSTAIAMMATGFSSSG
jgi:hypothetical protein